MRYVARALLTVGVVVTVAGLGKFHAAYVAEPPYDFTSSGRFVWSAVLVGAFLVTAYAAGLPDLTRSRVSIAVTSVASAAAAVVALAAVQALLGQALLPRFVLFSSGLVLAPWFGLCATVARDARALDADRDRVLVVGSWADAADLRDQLDRGAEREAKVIDVLTVPEAQPSGRLGRPLVEAVELGDVTVVVLDRDAQADEGIVDQVAELHERGVRIRTLSLFYDEWLGKLPMSELERVSLMFDIGELHRARYGRMKRLADLGLALVGLPLLVLLTPFVLVGNLVANRGPLVFRQRRVGRFGHEFTIYKFRTMHDGDESSAWTAEDDPRVTPFGRFLRRTHLDEAPQLVNVILGDLSLVGPRPEQPAYVEELTAKLPFYRLRHLVRPGLTGWAQVKFRYAASEADAMEKLQYEFYYLRHQGLALDARILVRTIRSITGRAGR